ncbi:CAMK family protein kinase [Tritrichomonas foetus]|uniref:CAMK family protein kinase n=1 Tax=Tritrichomonas foetus TaxID=1144522 RepID=A0A1J4K3Z7_9EUKA|nr:CAMK family protein kinase [Tritrichomonas foetus]|eukprot:OHT04484.1 CAMK family protein kinase [Tritrichomonas foetus]
MTTYPASISHYSIGCELGRGAFSVVCRATDLDDKGRVYACKIFPKENIQDPGDQEHFQREINAMSLMRHTNLVSLYDLIIDENNFYMILDYCPGGELFDYIVEHDRLDEDTAAFVFSQIVDAIEYCHSFGIAHRDLKPENIIITEFPYVKVSDFGLCGYINSGELMSSFCGSPCYCSPECLSKIGYDGRKSDIWSLGIILFAMVTGEHPWNILNTNVMLQQILTATFEVPEYVSPDCTDLIRKMIVVEPDDRLTIEEIKNHPFIHKARFINLPAFSQEKNTNDPNSQLDAFLENSNFQNLSNLHNGYHSMNDMEYQNGGLFGQNNAMSSRNMRTSYSSQVRSNPIVNSGSLRQLLSEQKNQNSKDVFKRGIMSPFESLTVGQKTSSGSSSTTNCNIKNELNRNSALTCQPRNSLEKIEVKPRKIYASSLRIKAVSNIPKRQAQSVDMNSRIGSQLPKLV